MCWLLQPRPLRDAISFPSIFVRRKGGHTKAARNAWVRSFAKDPCTLWIINTLTAGTPVQVRPAVPHVWDGTLDSGSERPHGKPLITSNSKLTTTCTSLPEAGYIGMRCSKTRHILHPCGLIGVVTNLRHDRTSCCLDSYAHLKLISVLVHTI